MSLMLLVLLILTSVTVTMVRTAFDNQSASRTAAARAQGRLYAAAALEEFYARVTTDEGFLRAALVFDPFSSDVSPHPGLRSSSRPYVGADGSDTGPWALLSMPSGWREGSEVVPTGSAPCPSGAEGLLSDCYYVTVFGDGTASGALPSVVVVEVTLRTRCAGNLDRCTFTRFQQRLRRTQFFEFALAQELATLAPEALFPAGSFDDALDVNRDEFLQYRAACGSKRGLVRSGVVLDLGATLGSTSSNTGVFVPDGGTLDVSGCVDMAYQSDATSDRKDTLSGPLYTADDFITVCGNPELSSVYVSGRGWDNDGDGYRESFRQAPSSSCVGSGLGGANQQTRVPMLLQPPADDVVRDAEQSATANVLEKVNPDTPVIAVFIGGQVSFTNTTLRSGSGCSALPGTRVRCEVDGNVLVVRNPNMSTGSEYASVDLHVSGVVRGMASLVVEGSVSIVGDLTYNSGGTTANTEDVLTLTASERIEIWQSCAEEPAPRSNACTDAADPDSPEDRAVHGILTSGLGYVGVPDWQYNTRNDRTQATLTFFGSIASRYQGVYGAYVEAGAAGRELVSGFYKNFAHDNLDRIVDSSNPTRDTVEEQLPFFVQTETAVWNRVDVTEVPYRP